MKSGVPYFGLVVSENEEGRWQGGVRGNPDAAFLIRRGHRTDDQDDLFQRTQTFTVHLADRRCLRPRASRIHASG